MIERGRGVDKRNHIYEPVRLHDAAVTSLNQATQTLVFDALDLHPANCSVWLYSVKCYVTLNDSSASGVPRNAALGGNSQTVA
jgi:hypothetical protein